MDTRRSSRWVRLAGIAALGAGVGLWVATGHWQWLVTPVAGWLVLLLGHGQVFVPQRERVTYLPARWRHHTLDESRRERTADWLGIVALFTGLVAWAWTGYWWLAVIGLAIWIGVTFATMHRQERRQRGRIDAAAAGVHEGIAHYEATNWPEALAAFDRVITSCGDDPTPTVRAYVATALYDKGLTLSRTGDAEGARAIYEHLVRHYAHDTTADAQQRVADARERLGLSRPEYEG